jgi:hypothetical protein
MFSWINRARSTVRGVASLGCAAALLGACGGGGGDGPVASTADFPIASAVSAYAQSSHQFNLAGVLEGVNFTMSYSHTPGAASTFEGKPASTATEAITLRANGVLAGQSTVTSYFAPSPFVSYGSIDQDDGTYSVVNQVANFPATAKVGQSGQVGTETEYADSKTRCSARHRHLGLDADTATTALFCLNVQISGATPGTEVRCYRSTAPAMSWASLSR